MFRKNRDRKVVDALLAQKDFDFLRDHQKLSDEWDYDVRNRFMEYVKRIKEDKDFNAIRVDEEDVAYTTFRQIRHALNEHRRFPGISEKQLLTTLQDQIVFEVEVNTNLIKHINDEVRSYDLHYSNIRTTVCTFLLTAALGTFALVANGKSTTESIRLFMLIPLIFVWTSFFFGAYFLKLTAACHKFQNLIEATNSATSPADTIAFPSNLAEPRRKIRVIHSTLKTFYWRYWDPPQKMLLIVTVLVSIISIALMIFPEIVKSKAMYGMPLPPWEWWEITQ